MVAPEPCFKHDFSEGAGQSAVRTDSMKRFGDMP